MVRRLLLFSFFGFVSCLLSILIYFLFTVTFFFGILYDLDLFLYNFVCLSSVSIPVRVTYTASHLEILYPLMEE